MPSNRKIVFANGEYYHLFNRGVERRPVFTNRREFSRAVDLINFYHFHKPPLRYSKYLALNEDQKPIFLSNLTEIAVIIVAFCLMGNHFHFLVKQVKESGVSKFMANFMNSYTKYFNTKYQRVGPLFQGAFKAVHIESDEQLLHLSRYIHLNPVMGFKIKADDLKDYEWSSYPSYTGSTDVSFVDSDIIMDFFKRPDKYQKFVLDQADYAKKLKAIEHLVID
ncbi:transposase [Candidatus Curtissbacteria bacterium]|nr:transposase [Candidatus Curtissbacteria bacterium]